jgi:hypothetical protein
MSLTTGVDIICTPGSNFEMETVTIGGLPTRVWKNVGIYI